MRTSRALAAIALAAFALTACSGAADGSSADDATEGMDDTMEDMEETDDAMDDMDDESMEGMDDDDAMDDMDDESMEGMDDDDAMDDMDGMDMGSSDGPRADEVESASLRQSDFTLLDSAPEAFASATGAAYLALGDSTTLTVDVAGLPAGTEVVGHLHAESCATSGGAHFMFDPDGGDTPPNEVHVAATADDSGSFSVTVTNEMSADGAMSIVIHAADGDTTKALCADLAA